MMIDNTYDFGEVIYLITDRDQLPRIVVGIFVYKDAEIMYKVNCGTQASEHYAFEMSPTKIMDFV
jgi:hypothetical protein